MARRATKDGHEQDALTPIRRHFIWKPGQRKAAKQAANRRDRRKQTHINTRTLQKGYHHD